MQRVLAVKGVPNHSVDIFDLVEWAQTDNLEGYFAAFPLDPRVPAVVSPESPVYFDGFITVTEKFASNTIYNSEEDFRKAALAAIVPFMKKTVFFTSNDLTVHRKLRAESGGGPLLPGSVHPHGVQDLPGYQRPPRPLSQRKKRQTGGGREGFLCPQRRV